MIPCLSCAAPPFPSACQHNRDRSQHPSHLSPRMQQASGRLLPGGTLAVSSSAVPSVRGPGSAAPSNGSVRHRTTTTYTSSQLHRANGVCVGGMRKSGGCMCACQCMQAFLELMGFISHLAHTNIHLHSLSLAVLTRQGLAASLAMLWPPVALSSLPRLLSTGSQVRLVVCESIGRVLFVYL